ncbi:hypothetical protein ABZP36_029084 [Zizania latifolia]
MNCIKIAMLVTLIPLALRGASLLGNDVVVVATSTEQQQPPGGSKNGVSSSSPALQAEYWRGRQHGKEKDQSRVTAFTRRRFGTGGGRGGGGGFFSDDKRFSPTGSNPLHN